MMTILIMLLLTPLTLKSTKSMLELQRIQPEMKRIQQEHRGDRQAMNEELMALYKEHKVNPLGGCLPLLIQAPIWIVMYRVFIGLTYKSAESEPFFAPKYLDHSTELYQDLCHVDRDERVRAQPGRVGRPGAPGQLRHRAPLPDPGGDRGGHVLRPAAPDHRPQQEQPDLSTTTRPPRSSR